MWPSASRVMPSSTPAPSIGSAKHATTSRAAAAEMSGNSSSSLSCLSTEALALTRVQLRENRSNIFVLPLSTRIAESYLPMRAVAKRLVLRRPAAAQRVVLGGSAVAELYAHKLDPPRDRLGGIIGHSHRRRSVLEFGLHTVDRIDQRA